MVARVAKWAGAAALGVIAAPLIYGLAALACALLPVSGRPQALVARDPVLFVCASLAHTDIVIPLSDDIGDWRSAFFSVAGDIPDDAYIAVGWGDLGFYRETPRWRDLKAGTALRALAGVGPATLHVLAVNARGPASGCVRIIVDRAGRQALARFILASAENDSSGFPLLIEQPRPGEAFYAAKGRWSPWRTCNAWAAEALAEAGLPTAIWAPFSFGVTWPLPARGAAGR
jgi:uncharacterized protein (TIGR02117 family)